jgi:hypothetical protein
MKKKMKLDEAFVVRANQVDYGTLLPMMNRINSREERKRLLGSFINTLNDFYRKEGFDIKIQ